MSPSNAIALGAWSAALAVIAGAFGAHALRGSLSPQDLELWRTAVLYHFLHALALVIYGLFARGSVRNAAPAALFLAGTMLFSGSLYALALGSPSWVGAITPLGGAAWIGAWIVFGWQARGGKSRLD